MLFLVTIVRGDARMDVQAHGRDADMAAVYVLEAERLVNNEGQPRTFKPHVWGSGWKIVNVEEVDR